MRLQSLLLALGIGVAGCSKSGCGAGPTYATLSDARGNIAFSPDGTSVVVPAVPRVYGYDLEARSTRWTHTAEKSGIGVAFSPLGRYVLIVESEYSDPTAFVLTLVSAKGSTVFRKQITHERNPGDAGQFVNRATRLFAISDDGAYVACAIFKQVVVIATADGATVYKETSEQFIDTVAFAPESHRLAVAGLSPGPASGRLWTVDRIANVWSRTDMLDNGFDAVWTTLGLFFASPAGLELWDGKSRRTVLPIAQAFSERGLSPVGNGSAPNWAVSPDGNYLASWNEKQIRVWKTNDAGSAPSAALLFTHDEPSISEGSQPRVLLVAFANSHFRAFTEAGDFIDLELPSGKLLSRKSFGALGSSSKAIFTDGVQHESNYSRGLSPNGRYVAQNTPEDGTKIYLME